MSYNLKEGFSLFPPDQPTALNISQRIPLLKCQGRVSYFTKLCDLLLWENVGEFLVGESGKADGSLGGGNYPLL